jgi:hypothetical protein
MLSCPIIALILVGKFVSLHCTYTEIIESIYETMRQNSPAYANNYLSYVQIPPNNLTCSNSTKDRWGKCLEVLTQSYKKECVGGPPCHCENDPVTDGKLCDKDLCRYHDFKTVLDNSNLENAYTTCIRMVVGAENKCYVHSRHRNNSLCILEGRCSFASARLFGKLSAAGTARLQNCRKAVDTFRFI